MKTKKEIGQDAVPEVEIDDPYDYVTSNTIIAMIIIKRKNNRKLRKLIRTKNDGYMTT